jgi:hypothetical protein
MFTATWNVCRTRRVAEWAARRRPREDPPPPGIFPGDAAPSPRRVAIPAAGAQPTAGGQAFALLPISPDWLRWTSPRVAAGRLARLQMPLRWSRGLPSAATPPRPETSAVSRPGDRQPNVASGIARPIILVHRACFAPSARQEPWSPEAPPSAGKPRPPGDFVLARQQPVRRSLGEGGWRADLTVRRPPRVKARRRSARKTLQVPVRALRTVHPAD